MKVAFESLPWGELLCLPFLAIFLMPLTARAEMDSAAQDDLLLQMERAMREVPERDTGPCLLGPAPEGIARLSQNQDDRRRRVFEMIYHSKELYSPGNCNANIWRLLDQFQKCGIDYQGAEVLFIVEDDWTIDVDNARLGSDPEGWLYHVVLELRGMIYDIDYAEAPTRVSASEYFKTMFMRRALSGWAKMSVRRIPAHGYYKDYDFDRTAEHGMYYYVLPEKNAFPTVRVRRFLTE